MIEEENYKLYVMGSGGVGKSALTVRLVQNRFSPAYDPTIEDSYVKLLTVDGKQVKLDILDTAGQDDFEAIRETYMRQGNGFIIVYALNDSASFDAIDKFQKDIRLTSGKPDIPIVACGNKCDLPDRAIDEDEAKSYFSSVKIPYYETSAYKDINVEASFLEVTRLMRKQNSSIKVQTTTSNSINIKNDNNKNQNVNSNDSQGGCCEIQ